MILGWIGGLLSMAAIIGIIALACTVVGLFFQLIWYIILLIFDR